MTSSNLILCRASAGSGKTFLLAKTYLQIVLNFQHEQYCNYDRILAVTFTNKATEEMKSRILEYLTEISRISNEEQCKQSHIAQALIEDNPTWTYQLLSWKSKIALSKILHDYSQFSIMTIDKFFNKIVKSFLFELNLQNAANVSMDTDSALDEALSKVLSEYSVENNQGLSKWIKDIATKNLEDGKSWNPEQLILKLSKELFKENIAQIDLNFDIENLELFYQDAVRYENIFLNTLKSIATKILEIVDKNGMQKGIFKSNYFPNQTKKIIEDKILSKDIIFSRTVAETIEGDENPFNKASQNEENLQVWQEQIQPLSRELLTYFNHGVATYYTYNGFRKYIKVLALLSKVSDNLKEYRERNRLMLISDNNQLIQKVVGNTDASFLYEKIGNKYRYILLDEFQDTSTLQWKNFVPLITEVLSHSEESRVLIVGDAKQAIYRWRGGNLQLIVDEVQKDLATIWKGRENELELNKNYRSLFHVVEFNNQVFKKLSNYIHDFIVHKYELDENITPIFNNLLEIYPENSTVQIPQNTSGGYVEVRFFDKNSSEENTEEEDSEEDPVLSYVLNKILFLKNEMDYSFQDITILVRTNNEAIQIADFLKSKQIQIMTSEALLFSSHAVICLLIDTLYYLLHPTEDIYQSSVLYQYAQVHHLVEKHPDVLDLERRGSYFEKWLSGIESNQLSQILSSVSIYEIVMKLMDILNLNSLRDVYTEQFLDLVMQFQNENTQISIVDFIEWWELNKFSVSISGDIDAVQISTIHKSKGLEYNVVIIPYLNWSFVDASGLKQPILWPKIIAPEEMHGFETLPIDFNAARKSLYVGSFQDEVILQACDQLNVTYVALTRAIEKMYICCNIHLKAKNPEESLNSIGKALHYYLSKEYPENFSEENIYTFGAENKKISDVDSVKNEQWISLDSQTSPHHLSLAKIEFSNVETIVGEFIHQVMAKYRSGDNVEKLLNKIAVSYNLETSVLEEVFQRVRTFFMSPEIQNLYLQEGQIFTERSFVFEDKLYRFDFLILKNKVGKLYDFKTGAESGNAALNKKNLKTYRTALQKLGYNIQEAAFIFMSPEGFPKFEYIEA